MKPLRPYQTAAYRSAVAHIVAGRRRVCICGPCGMGKTRLGAEFCLNGQAKGSRALWLTHRETLVRQSYGALTAEGVECDIIMAGTPRNYRRIAVASVPTLLARDMRPEVDFLIADECHHFVSPEYLALLQAYPRAVLIGLTATPSRPDGVGLHNIFDALVPVCQPRELIASGHLVPAKVIGPQVEVKNAAEYPVDFYRAHCPGEFCVVLCLDIKQARALASTFTVAGIPAGYIDSEMDDGPRAATLARYESGQLRVLTSVNIFLEGWDSPQTSAVILARRMGSAIAYVQATGRAMRPFPGKVRALIGDLFGSSHSLGILPDGDRQYSLEGKGVRSSRGSLLEIVQCPSCGAVFEAGVFAGGTCPACGWVKPAKPDPRVVRQQMIELQEKRLQRPAGQGKVAWLQEQLACRRGATGGLLIQFSKVFHHFPDHSTREASGFNACLAREKAAREAKKAS